MNERGIWYFLSHLLIIFTETNSIFLCFNYSNHHVCIKINCTNRFRSLMPTATCEVSILLELGFVESSSETNFTRATKPSSRRMLTVCRRVRFWLFYQIGVRMYCLRLRIDYIRRRILAFPADQQVVGLMLAAGYLPSSGPHLPIHDDFRFCVVAYWCFIYCLDGCTMCELTPRF